MVLYIYTQRVREISVLWPTPIEVKAWVNKYIYNFRWDVTTYPCNNFNSGSVNPPLHDDLLFTKTAWKSNYFPQSDVDVITYHYPKLV